MLECCEQRMRELKYQQHYVCYECGSHVFDIETGSFEKYSSQDWYLLNLKENENNYRTKLIKQKHGGRHAGIGKIRK